MLKQHGRRRPEVDSVTAHRFQKEGLLALRPQAFFMAFEEPARREVQTLGDTAIVEILGPLAQRKSWWDSYEEIVERVDVACASNAGRIVMRIDSPGGELYGCFDAARAIRSKCAAAGKKLIAFVDGDACSAAYALACAASRIVVSETSFVGSIGVMESRVDVTGADARIGDRYAIVTSGARKADRHPHVAINDAELASTQTRVESLAAVFYDLVAEMRPGLSRKSIRALDAGVLHGAAAVRAGLADQVASFDALLESRGNTMAQAQRKNRGTGEQSRQQQSVRQAQSYPRSESELRRQVHALSRRLDVMKRETNELKRSEGREATRAASSSSSRAERDTSVIDQAMGTAPLRLGVHRAGNRVSFGFFPKVAASRPVAGELKSSTAGAVSKRRSVDDGERASCATGAEAEAMDRAMGIRRQVEAVRKTSNRLTLEAMTPTEALKRYGRKS